jgi:hypothetical protein
VKIIARIEDPAAIRKLIANPYKNAPSAETGVLSDCSASSRTHVVEEHQHPGDRLQ